LQALGAFGWSQAALIAAASSKQRRAVPITAAAVRQRTVKTLRAMAKVLLGLLVGPPKPQVRLLIRQGNLPWAPVSHDRLGY
jgi:hypothetical protein